MRRSKVSTSEIGEDLRSGPSFDWDIFGFADDVVATDYGFGSADGLWADPDGRLIIQTDGDSLKELTTRWCWPTQIRVIFSGVEKCEITGRAVTPDCRAMFVNVRHPGNGDPEVTRFPDYNEPLPPRDYTVVLNRKDGGVIGS